jgi:hypothetical protein
MGGAARFVHELRRYLREKESTGVRVVGEGHRVEPGWLARREVMAARGGRKVALNNVGFIGPGGERWTLLRNALHFLADSERHDLNGSLSRSVRAEAAIVRCAALRSDVLVVPSSAMAERVERVVPAVRDRLVVRHHPVSHDSIPVKLRDPAILCPVLFAPFKRMDGRLTSLADAIDAYGDPAVELRITAQYKDLPKSLAHHPRVVALGRLRHDELRLVWAHTQAIYFPTSLESFGYPLAEARVSGHPVIAHDTAQNRQIGGPALCGFSPGDDASLREAVARALSTRVRPDPAPFDPHDYFGWLLRGGGQ